MEKATKGLLITYIREQYGDEAMYIFKNSPEIGVCRHGENGKWYAVFMPVAYKKFGIGKKGETEVVTLKCIPQLGASVADGQSVFPAYHMNKEHWISILLDGSADCGQAKSLIDLSYNLTLGAKSKKKE